MSNLNNWYQINGGNTDSAPRRFTCSSDDDLVSIQAVGYFADKASLGLSEGDYIDIAVDNDGTRTVYSFTTGAVPSGSHIVAAGEHITVGGSASESVSVTGVLSTDFAFFQMATVGGAPATLLTAKAQADSVDLVFSADPTTDHVLSYQVIRTA